MTQHHDKIYALHMLECIEAMERFLQEDRARFMKDDMVQNAVLRKLQIIAESSIRLPDRWKKNAEVNWKALAVFRHILVHDYLGDLENIDKHLPALKETLHTILPEMEKESL